MEKLGITEADLERVRVERSTELAALDAYVPHAEFERHADADGRTRYREPTDCKGTLRVSDDTTQLWTLDCDGCSFSVTVPMHRVDPKRMLARVLGKAGIPEMFVDKPFDGQEPSQAPTLQACREWIQGFKREPLPSIGLFGHAGRGKSHLLSLILQGLAKKWGVDVLYRSELAMFDELQAGMDGGNYEIAWQRVLRAPVLALDDLGVGVQTPWKLERRMALVDYRYSKELPMIYATNIAQGGWEKVFGERTASRLRGMSCVLHLEGPDRRAHSGTQQQMAVAS